MADLAVVAAVKDNRSDRRTNLFVTATLYAGEGSVPARIRNLSRAGALVEAAVLPAPGTRVRLARGSLNVTGTVVWREGGRAGLRFGSHVSVPDWLPQGQAAVQARVDQVIHDIRSGPIGHQLPSPAPNVPLQTTAEELAQVQMLIQSAAERLAADPAVLSDHSDKLQMLDIAGYRIANLLSVKCAAGRL